MDSALERFRKKQQEQIHEEIPKYQEPQIQGWYGGKGELTKIIREEQLSYADQFKKMTLTIPELPDEFRSIPEITSTLTSSEDFSDDSWKDISAIELKRINSHDEIIEYGRDLFSRLGSGISQRHVASIFILAFQLRQAGIGTNPHLLPEIDELHRPSDFNMNILDDDVFETSGTVVQPTEKGGKADIAQAYAFLAASMLKMFTRSPENYERSWTHIVEGYGKFYSGTCPVTCPTPNLTVIKRIHDHFSISEIMKATLYRYLYNANGIGSPSSVQKYLYDIHLSHTGMHVVPIAYKICNVMNCTPSVLMRVVYSHRFKPQISGLIAAFKLMQNTDEKHKRQMWKYGRIFDSSFLASLQTRTCPKFVYILACVLKKESARSHSGILDIKQLEEVGPDDQERLKEGANVLIRAINLLIEDQQPGLITQIMSAQPK